MANAHDTNRIHEMREKTYAPSTTPQSSSANEEENSTNSVRPHIGVSIPQPFEPVDEISYEPSNKLSKIINSLMSEIFVDFAKSKIYYNPQVGGVGCTLRFVYTSPEVASKSDKIVALSTLAKETHATNEWAEDIKKINATIQNKSNTSNAIITKLGKQYLEDIVITGSDGKVHWDNNNIVSYNESNTFDTNGRATTIITMDVSINLNRLLQIIYNGTFGDFADYNNFKKYFYTTHFHSSINGHDFLVRIVKTDTKKQKQVAEDIGYHQYIPTSWNNPVPFIIQ